MTRQSITEKLMKNPSYREQIERKTTAALNAPAKPSKFRNQRCEWQGQQFDSKLERDVYIALVGVYGKENVIRQVSMPIGGKRIRPDFLIIHERFEDGTFRAELADAKGVVTEGWSAKANHLESVHGLENTTDKEVREWDELRRIFKLKNSTWNDGWV